MANSTSKPASLRVGNRTVAKVSVSEYNTDTDRGTVYQLSAGEGFRFPAFTDDLQLEKVPVTAGSNNFYYLIHGDIIRADKSEEPSYFNLNSLNKRDVNGVAVNPSWQGLSPEERVKALCKMQEIKVVEMKTIDSPVYDGGQRKVVIDENNVQHYVTRPQTVPVITPYVGK